MKKLLAILIISICMNCVSYDVRAGWSPTKKIVTGVFVGSGALCLLGYYLYHKRKREEKISKLVGGAAGLTIFTGATLACNGVYDYLKDDDGKPGDDPDKNNIMLPNGSGVDFCMTTLGITESEYRKSVRNVKAVSNDRSFNLYTLWTLSKTAPWNARLYNDDDRYGDLGSYCRFIVSPSVDVKDLQAREKNNGATFQVASNFNCLEAGQQYGKPSDSNSLQRIHAQGEQAVITTMPAYLYRKYEHHKNVNLLENLLRRCEEYMAPGSTLFGDLTMSEGGKEIKDVGCIKMKKGRVTHILSIKDFNDYIYSISVGVHRNISVTHDGNLRNIMDRGQKINHILVSALDRNKEIRVNVPKNKKNKNPNKNPDDIRDHVERTILNMMYMGTVKATYYMVKGRKLFLTLVGGGVFKNKMENIAHALCQSLNWAKQKNMQVTVVCRMKKLPTVLEKVRLDCEYSKR